MPEQITDTIMMVRPVHFYMNEQTSVNNYYQKSIEGLSSVEIQKKAVHEFDQFVIKLRSAGIDVIVFYDTPEPATPDSIFPNNWISFHEDGQVLLYPMFADNRRLERRDDIIESLSDRYSIKSIGGFTDWEHHDKFLEGTGSLILDRTHKIGYAALSVRTDQEVLNDFSENTGYKVITFNAFQTVNGKRLPIYHTNVMMCVGEGFAVVCLDSIDNVEEREHVITSLENTGKEVISISENQKEHFAGNMLHVKNKSGQPWVVMSTSAYNSLSDSQLFALRKHGELLHSSLDTIEALGGGSARCMMAEVFLPKKEK